MPLEQKLDIVAKRGRLGEAIRYGLTRWEGFTRFPDDGRIEIDSNIVERSVRPITLNRKNALFAGSDEGGAAWGVVASLIETCKLRFSELQPAAWSRPGELRDALLRCGRGFSLRSHRARRCARAPYQRSF